MFRSAHGKILRRMFDHSVIHDLSSMPSHEIGLLFLLMTISGNSSSPSGRYGFNGCMQIHFPDAQSAIASLRSRGYLVDTLPFNEMISRVTVSELKELLKAHGLHVSGKRAELVERITPALTDSEISSLHESHDFWLPSDLGFEMIYSLYDLWERRQLDLIDAIESRNRNAVFNACKHMPYNVGFWDDSISPRSPSSDVINTAFEFSNTVPAFVHLCGFKPEFNIREEPVYRVSNSVQSLYQSHHSKNTFPSSFSESENDPAPYSKNRSSCSVYLITTLILMVIVYFLSRFLLG